AARPGVTFVQDAIRPDLSRRFPSFWDTTSGDDQFPALSVWKCSKIQSGKSELISGDGSRTVSCSHLPSLQTNARDVAKTGLLWLNGRLSSTASAGATRASSFHISTRNCSS